MTDETFTEPSEHERRVAQEEGDGNGQPVAEDSKPTGAEIEAEQTGKRWEQIDAENSDLMDEERDEPPPAGYNPRTG